MTHTGSVSESSNQVEQIDGDTDVAKAVDSGVPPSQLIATQILGLVAAKKKDAVYQLLIALVEAVILETSNQQEGT